MKIVESELFKRELSRIVHYIKQDKPSAAKKFAKKLTKQIHTLVDSPYRCHPSYYFESNDFRDMVFLGYTIVYKINNDEIILISIFNQNLPLMDA